jgi:hypothetical protein
MQNPEPPNQPTTWNKYKPSQKTVGGAVLGQLVGQFLVLAADQYMDKKPSPELAIAGVGLIQAIFTYLIPNKPAGD